MAQTIDYYYSHLSPWAYLGHQRLLDLACEKSVEICFLPVESGPVFSASGGLPLNKRPVSRQDYRLVELKRWRDALDTPLILKPKHHPGPDAPSSRLALAAKSVGADMGTFSLTLMKALWVDDQNLADDAVLQKYAEDFGLDGSSLLEKANSAEIQDLLAANTERAISEGVFGYPWYSVNGEPFWGQDRLDQLAQKLESL